MLRNTFSFFACLSLIASSLLAQETLSSVDALAVPITPVSVSSDLLNPTSAAEWISLDAENGVSGKLGALDEAGVWVAKPGVAVSLSINGKLVSQSVTDVSGQFRLPNVRPGTYAFVASSNYSFATFGVHVYANGTNFPTLMEVATTNIPVSQARAIVKDHWVPNISSQDYYRVLASDPLGANRSVSNYKIRLIDGDLAGRVSRPGWGFGEQDLSGNVAHVIRGTTVVATAAVQSDGRYVVKNLAPGVYDLIVAGDDGVAAVGFEAVGPEPVAMKSGAKVHYVSQDTAADSINLEMVLPSDVFIPGSEEVPFEPIVEIFPPGFGPGFGGGGMGGGSGGGMGGGSGGGAGGGMGGGGALLGLAGLAGLAALGQDDGFNANLATQIQ